MFMTHDELPRYFFTTAPTQLSAPLVGQLVPPPEARGGDLLIQGGRVDIWMYLGSTLW